MYLLSVSKIIPRVRARAAGVYDLVNSSTAVGCSAFMLFLNFIMHDSTSIFSWLSIPAPTVISPLLLFVPLLKGVFV